MRRKTLYPPPLICPVCGSTFDKRDTNATVPALEDPGRSYPFGPTLAYVCPGCKKAGVPWVAPKDDYPTSLGDPRGVVVLHKHTAVDFAELDRRRPPTSKEEP